MSGYEESFAERTQVGKLWGWEEWLVNNDQYCAKLLWITPGVQCSLHYHDIKRETFVAMDGLTRVEYYVDGKKFDTILSGQTRDALTISPGTAHRFWAMGKAGSVLLEVSTTHADADVTRLEPSRIIGGEIE